MVYVLQNARYISRFVQKHSVRIISEDSKKDALFIMHDECMILYFFLDETFIMHKTFYKKFIDDIQHTSCMHTTFIKSESLTHCGKIFIVRPPSAVSASFQVDLETGSLSFLE